jgi:6-phospho-beta-glucosidase
VFVGNGSVRVAVVLSMKVVVLGGSAHSTPALWSYLVSEARLQGLNVVLVGRDRGRLNAVVRACEILASTRNNSLASATIPYKGAWRVLNNADVVLIQFRNGGYLARGCDETFPVQYGIVGDEGLGPGGLCAAIRNWKAIGPALECIAEFARGALVLMMSSPVGLLVRAAGHGFPHLNVAGICELPWTTLTDTCRTAGIDPQQVRFDYFGVNHLGWLYGITQNGRNVASVVPLKYLRLHEHRNTVLEEQRQAVRPRAVELEEISRKAFQIYTAGDEDQVRQASQMRSTPWYRHAVGPLIASLAGSEIRTVFFLSVCNNFFDSAYRKDDILEYAHIATGGTLQRVPRINRVPVEMRHTLSPFIEYERVAVRAVLNPDNDLVEESLCVHPWVKDCGRVKELAQEILNYAHGA